MALFRRSPISKPRESVTSHESGTQRVRVSGRVMVSDDAMLLRLDSANPSRPAKRFPAGAHLDVHVRPGVLRQYSLVGVPDVDEHYLVCVQREPQGRGGSIAVHEELRDGVEIEVSAPRSTFELIPGAGRSLLIGGGIGLTPLVSMAEHLHRSGRDFEFHVYARNAPSLPLHDELAGRAWADRLHRHFSDDGDSFRASGPPALDAVDQDGAVYVCGPAGFIGLAVERALAAGWSPGRVVTERFTASDPAVHSGGAFEVVAASTGERMAVAESESIADVLERAGYETYRSCGQGYCGSCVVSVRAGVPDHRDDFQTPKQHAANNQINVCVSRSLTPVLELDV